MGKFLKAFVFNTVCDADGNAVLVYTKTGVWVVTYNGANRPIRFRNDSTDTTVDCGYIRTAYSYAPFGAVAESSAGP